MRMAVFKGTKGTFVVCPIGIYLDQVGSNVRFCSIQTGRVLVNLTEYAPGKDSLQLIIDELNRALSE